MLIELYQYLTTKCPPVAKRMGYLREAIAIHRRYARHRKTWEPHLEATKKVIREAIEASSGGTGTAVVLGSGLLVDIPLDELSDAFDRVELVDLIHMKPVRWIVEHYPNVGLVEADVTDVAGALVRFAAGEGALPVPQAPDLPGVDLDDVRLVVSANLVSQLPLVPGGWLKRRTKLDDDAVYAFGGRLVRAHLDWLLGLAERGITVCLIADVEREFIDRDENPVQTYDGLYGERLPGRGHTWRWTVGPAGEVRSGITLRNKVVGIPDLAKAAAAAK
jgi:hypothetical protein